MEKDRQLNKISVRPTTEAARQAGVRPKRGIQGDSVWDPAYWRMHCYRGNRRTGWTAVEEEVLNT